MTPATVSLQPGTQGQSFPNIEATLASQRFFYDSRLLTRSGGLSEEFVLCPPADTPLLADGRLRKAFAPQKPMERDQEIPMSSNGSRT